MPDDAVRLIEHEVTDPYLNLAYEEGILEAMRFDAQIPSTIRLWRNDRSVIVGRFQSVGDEVDIDACKEFSVRIARRCSGGGAVYNDMGNLNWSVYLRPQRYGGSLEIKSYLQFVGTNLAANLRNVGLDANFASNAVFVGGRKVSGLAMYIKGNYRLLHGTLLVKSDLRILNKVLKTSYDDNSRYTRSLHVPTTNLSSELSEQTTLDSGFEIVKTAVLEAIGATAEIGDPTQLERELAKEKMETKYSQSAWIFSIP